MEQLAAVAASTLVGGAATLALHLLRRERATRLGVQALLRAHMVNMVRHYLALGELPLYERDNLSELYKQYKNLGGNGAVESLVQRLMALPTPREEKGECHGTGPFYHGK